MSSALSSCQSFGAGGACPVSAFVVPRAFVRAQASCFLQVILARQYGSEGRFTFTSHTPGEHQICLHSNSTKFSLFAGGMLRVHLDIQVGEHANDYAEIAAKDKLSELQLRVRQLVEQVEQIQKEQNYQRVSARARACDQREHQPAGAVVVHSADPHPRGRRCLADAAPQELL
uniref:GOLD domain-containing protein n=1 Tax=Oryctolagus cuniculus TaxID=9986 RepID=A0A5F9D7H1_RABIT